MNPLKLIIKTEYLTDVRAKSFWISTFVVPIAMVVFGLVIGFLMSESGSMKAMGEMSTMHDTDTEMTAMQAMGMMSGLFLTIFLSLYGGQIFNKVKVEKTNRIIEVIATCVTGRTMMLGKIISVGLVGLTQLLLWGSIVFLLIAVVLLVFDTGLSMSVFLRTDVIMGVVWSILFFIGGYLFYGSLFAAGGAMTDKNNENQVFVSIISFTLFFSLYLGMFATDNGATPLSIFCTYFPFTAPTVATVQAVSGTFSWWQSLIALLVLYGFAILAWIISGKLYTASMLLTGKKLTPKDLVTFIKAK